MASQVFFLRCFLFSLSSVLKIYFFYHIFISSLVEWFLSIHHDLWYWHQHFPTWNVFNNVMSLIKKRSLRLLTLFFNSYTYVMILATCGSNTQGGLWSDEIIGPYFSFYDNRLFDIFDARNWNSWTRRNLILTRRLVFIPNASINEFIERALQWANIFTFWDDLLGAKIM